MTTSSTHVTQLKNLSNMATVLTYNGYELQSDGSSYQSKINGKVRKFDTAVMFVQYINYLTNNGKTE